MTSKVRQRPVGSLSAFAFGWSSMSSDWLEKEGREGEKIKEKEKENK